MTPQKILRFVHWAILAMWPPVVMAGGLTFGQAVAKVTALEWILVIVLSTLAGLTALFIRVSRYVNEAPDGVVLPPIRNMTLLVCAQMSGSLLAGIMAFFGASQYNMDGLLVGFFVPAVSFGGAKSLEFFYNMMVAKKIGGPNA